MKLEYLKLKHFRQYYGEQTIRFACDSLRNVTVIHGVNGAGKTSLFTALNWCLYGEGADMQKKKIGDLVSKRAITEANIDPFVETSVRLVFTHEQERYIVERKLEGYMSKQQIESRNEKFALWQTRHDGQTEEVREPEWKIASILPASVRTYFFFDGEKIDNFARPGHEKEVEDAVRNVLKIEAIERAKRHLEAIVRDYQSELKKHTTGRLQELIEQKVKKELERDKLSNGLEEKQKELESAQKQMQDIDSRLAEIQSARVLNEKRKQIEDSRKTKQQQENRLWNEIRDITNRSFIFLAKPAFDKAMIVLDRKRERGEIPSGIREQFLNDLIEQMLCICGRPITDGSTEHQNLINFLNRSVSSKLEDIVLETGGDLKRLIPRVPEIPDQLINLMKQRRNLNDEIESLDGRLKEISDQLIDFEEEEGGNLEKKRRKHADEIRRLEAEINHAKGRIEEIDKERKQLDEKIEKEQASEEKTERLRRCYTLASKSAEAAGKMVDLFAHDMREIIQTEVQKIFKQLIWKESHFQNIHLSEDYRLDVIDRYGMAARPEMSAGERQVLSLAFIAGMAKVAKEEETFPLVMDTPFGRLSSAHREKITEHLPEIADGLILFVTDEELHGQARNNLEPRIGEEYKLVFDHETSCTEIQEVKR
ncbi:AAA family ATPase [Candidatus Poribacteria bacterium]|nr:AAA family ATPase [Candidatus Poribacteria bacterium]